MIEVVAALIYRNNDVLIAKRSTGDENVYDKWEFPGGKVEPGEIDEIAIEREIKEEFEIEIKAEKFLINNICEYPNKTINLKLYLCKYINGNIILHDHSEYKWTKIDNLLEYDFGDADIALANYVREKLL